MSATSVGFRDGFKIGFVMVAVVFALLVVIEMFVRWDFGISAKILRLWLAFSVLGGLFGGVAGLFE